MDTDDETITHIASIAYRIWYSRNMIFFFFQNSGIQKEDHLANARKNKKIKYNFVRCDTIINKTSCIHDRVINRSTRRHH